MQGHRVPGATSSGFAGEEEGKVGFDEFMLPVGHLRKAPSKQEELDLEFPRNIGADDRNVWSLKPIRVVRRMVKEREGRGQSAEKPLVSRDWRWGTGWRQCLQRGPVPKEGLMRTVLSPKSHLATHTPANNSSQREAGQVC